MHATFKVVFLVIAVLCVAIAEAAGDGLRIGILRKVPAEDCLRKSRKDDIILVHYQGKLQDGTEFDSSYKRKEPFKFTLGKGQVIPGWDRGLLSMCIGEKRKLTIPPNLAYGEKAIGPIPASSTLTFEVELLQIAGYDAKSSQTKKAPEPTPEGEFTIQTAPATPEEDGTTVEATREPAATPEQSIAISKSEDDASVPVLPEDVEETIAPAKDEL
ncbi:hypothetical protein V1514DRAFT_35230 [Lipomyces japonicus]|uniref:uncharacterized protein n=1 Tax=Lipomyces japonicus TaxID=56871 RepID=UPI0034CF870E